jgi:hypothetical protein
MITEFQAGMCLGLAVGSLLVYVIATIGIWLQKAQINEAIRLPK